MERDKPIERTATQSVSLPTFASGRCPTCHKQVPLPTDIVYNGDPQIKCMSCGKTTNRLAIINHAIGWLDSVAWGSLCSNFILTDHDISVSSLDTVTYSDMPTESVTEWLHCSSWPNVRRGDVPYVTLSFNDIERSAMLFAFNRPLTDPTQFSGIWTRFGITTAQIPPPAWRQSLYSAYSLAVSHPASSIVMSAASFEAFFMESMLMSWEASVRDIVAFKRLSDNTGITNLVNWLPQVLGRPPFEGSARSNWQQLVNRRRNDVVHRARVNFGLKEAAESISATVDAILALDSEALVRPHAYYSSANPPIE